MRITPAHAGKSRTVKTSLLTNGDHPRTCGEKTRHQMLHCHATGSPPHMRGKETQHAINLTAGRITPAHAGKRLPACPAVLWGGDHPRTCGEKPVAMHSCTMTRGSPPHMRGKGIQHCNKRVGVGITPAHAGKRGAARPEQYKEQDHPRTCGEKGWPCAMPAAAPGSPPHMRGKD